MKKLIILLSILFSNLSFGQPDPSWFYPEKIEYITEQLKTDSLNYKLIWERLGMKVSLLMKGSGAEQFQFVFIHYPNATTCEKIDCKEYQIDFEKIYNATFISKEIQLTPFEYYISRIYFYTSTLQLDKAYDDLTYLKNNISLSEEWETKIDLYFFKIYVLRQNYEKALETINLILEKEKDKYYSSTDPRDKYKQKVGLFKYFNKETELFTYLKQHCKESFDLYFKSKKESKYDRNLLKENSFAYLKELIYYLKEYDREELPKYQKIYSQISYMVNDNYEIINPNINDMKLKSIVSEIK